MLFESVALLVVFNGATLTALFCAIIYYYPMDPVIDEIIDDVTDDGVFMPPAPAPPL